MSTTLHDSLRTLRRIVIPRGGATVNRTVAEELRARYAPEATIEESVEVTATAGAQTLAIGIAGEPGVVVPENTTERAGWIACTCNSAGASLMASQRHLLYGLFSLVADDWGAAPVETFASGRIQEPAFKSIVAFDGHYGFWRRFTRGYDPEAAIRETARMGCACIAVNALPNPNAYEQGPNGEIYYRFYQYLPDIDQFVDTRLNRGIYPQEYLQANLNFLKEQAALAVKYGLTPGMQVANPRSAPEAFFEKYPYLRGPRIDHTYRSYLPRYTMTLGHPLVRWHYAQLMETLLREIPDLGFISTLINDSGSGFEYTESLYAGRNGGPYMVREWRSQEEIARAAASLIIRYYQLMRDTARKINPAFRLLVGLNNVEEEKQTIYDGLSDGLDRMERTQRYDSVEDLAGNQALEARGSLRVSYASAEGNPYILGIPSPWQTYRALERERDFGTSSMELDYDPPSLAPFDVNRAVVRHFQFGSDSAVDDIIRRQAEDWVGHADAASLVELWQQCDRLSAESPVWPLYGNLGFAWYRFWVRPFVPNIGKIPVKDRFYYEEYILTHFNNPHNVDFKADALWEIHPVAEMEAFLKRYDETVLPGIKQALNDAEARSEQQDNPPATQVFVDLRDRLRAYQCYSRTLRNVAKWIVNVHGYLGAKDDGERACFREGVREMMANEMANTRELLDLWETSSVHFMPIHHDGEWMHDYGPNFGDLLRRKLELMAQYQDDEPYIDPNFMWKMPDPDDIELAPHIREEEYLGY